MTEANLAALRRFIPRVRNRSTLSCRPQPCSLPVHPARARNYLPTAEVLRSSVDLSPLWGAAEIGPAPRDGVLVRFIPESGEPPRLPGKRRLRHSVYPRAWRSHAVTVPALEPAVGSSPRVGGFHAIGRLATVQYLGSSPRVWGSHTTFGYSDCSSGVYPRVWGSHDLDLAEFPPLIGSSPRGGSQQLDLPPDVRLERFIPARGAGMSIGNSSRRTTSVYPRT